MSFIRLISLHVVTKNFGFDAADNSCELISFSATPATQKLAKKLKAAGETLEFLVQDIPTRWWSSYDVMDRINEKRHARRFGKWKNISPHPKSTSPTESEWITIRFLLEMLKPFKEEQLEPEGDQYATISRVPVFCWQHSIMHCREKTLQ